jgi:hypothetical protein
MKRVFFVLLLGALSACSAAPRSVEIAAPLSRAAIVPAHDDEVAIPRGAKPVKFGAEAPWAAAFPKSKKFATYEMPSASRVVLLTWRVGKSHIVNAVESPEEDYPGNHAAPVELVVRARNETRTIAFGDMAGFIQPTAIEWCAPPSDHKSNAAFAAEFSIGTMQGDDEMVVVRDTRTLHVLHRETSDGHCEDAKQGPLEICEGGEWQLVADIHVTPGAAIYETVESEGKPFDCSPE